MQTKVPSQWFGSVTIGYGAISAFGGSHRPPKFSPHAIDAPANETIAAALFWFELTVFGALWDVTPAGSLAYGQDLR